MVEEVAMPRDDGHSGSGPTVEIRYRRVTTKISRMSHLSPDWIIDPKLCAYFRSLGYFITCIEVNIDPRTELRQYDFLFERSIDEDCTADMDAAVHQIISDSTAIAVTNEDIGGTNVGAKGATDDRIHNFRFYTKDIPVVRIADRVRS